MVDSFHKRLKKLQITLPHAPKPSANYLPYRSSGNHIFIAGQISITSNENIIGKVGQDLTIDQGYSAARLCGLNILAQLRLAAGDNIDFVQAVKLGGFVNATNDFKKAPMVINGVSDLLVEVMGLEKGGHARFAVAVASLPAGAAVEVDAIFEIP